jgi:hypothetical protein
MLHKGCPAIIGLCIWCLWLLWTQRTSWVWPTCHKALIMSCIMSAPSLWRPWPPQWDPTIHAATWSCKSHHHCSFVTLTPCRSHGHLSVTTTCHRRAVSHHCATLTSPSYETAWPPQCDPSHYVNGSSLHVLLACGWARKDWKNRDIVVVRKLGYIMEIRDVRIEDGE